WAWASPTSPPDLRPSLQPNPNGTCMTRLRPSATRRALLAAGGLALATPFALAQDVVRIGLVAEMSGPFAEFGKQMQAGIQVYQKQFGDTVAGRKVEVIIKDVGGPNPEVAKRLAQE